MDNLAAVHYFLNFYNAAEWDGIQALMAPGYAHHNNDMTLDTENFIAGAKWFRSAMPDFRIEPCDTVCEGDRVAVRFIGTGTHRGSMFGEVPTGRTITVHGIMIYRVEDGLISEDWEALDEHALRAQVVHDG